MIRSNGPSAVRLVPAVRESLPEVPEASTSDAAQSRFLLFDAVTTFLQRLTARMVQSLAELVAVHSRPTSLAMVTTVRSA